MKITHSVLLAALLAVGAPNYAAAEVNVGIHLSLFPDLIPVPGYPVYYAPQLEANFFFYDGEYWLYEDDGWYTSHWYDGPWEYVDPDDVPLFVLRVPVRYYRAPPPFFRGWYYDDAPRWGHYWGPTWQNRHRDWERWDRNRAPRPAPLPTYQRHYSGEQYPNRQQQHEIRERNYPHHSNRSNNDNRGGDADRNRSRDQGANGWGRDSQRERGGDGSRQQSAPDHRQPDVREFPQGGQQDRRNPDERRPDSVPSTNMQRERTPQAPRYSAPQQRERVEQPQRQQELQQQFQRHQEQQQLQQRQQQQQQQEQQRQQQQPESVRAEPRQGGWGRPADNVRGQAQGQERPDNRRNQEPNQGGGNGRSQDGGDRGPNGWRNH